MTATPRQNGFKRIFVPASDAPEAALIPDIEVYAVSSLRDLYLHLTNQQLIKLHPHIEAESVSRRHITDNSHTENGLCRTVGGERRW